MASDLPVEPRDLFLARDLDEARARRYLAERGFRDPAGADERLQRLAADLQTRLALGELADLLLETTLEAPDPDAALTGFCRYAAKRVPKSSFIGYLQDDPRALQILTRVVGASALLGEILIRDPEYLHWLQGELDCPPPDQVDYRAEVDALLAQDRTAPRRLDSLKRFQRREILRIAGRDLLDKDTLRSTTEQLADLAAVVVAGALRIARNDLAEREGATPPGAFVVIGLGRLGRRELDYSQDIHVLYVYEADEPDAAGVRARFQRLGQRLTAILEETTGEGHCYRIDLGLRPPGAPGRAPPARCRRAFVTAQASARRPSASPWSGPGRLPASSSSAAGSRTGSGRSSTARTPTAPPSGRWRARGRARTRPAEARAGRTASLQRAGAPCARSSLPPGSCSSFTARSMPTCRT